MAVLIQKCTQAPFHISGPLMHQAFPAAEHWLPRDCCSMVFGFNKTHLGLAGAAITIASASAASFFLALHEWGAHIAARSALTSWSSASTSRAQ